MKSGRKTDNILMCLKKGVTNRRQLAWVTEVQKDPGTEAWERNGLHTFARNIHTHTSPPTSIQPGATPLLPQHEEGKKVL